MRLRKFFGILLSAGLSLMVFYGCGTGEDGLEETALWEEDLGQNLSPAGIGSWKLLSVGENHSCAIGKDGTLNCWGNNDYGQLGDNTLTQRDTPVRIGIDTNWKAVSAGKYHTCALKTDNSLYCWGRNWEGQLGDGTGVSKAVPTLISPGWSMVSAGGFHTCGRKTDGSIYCWGLNDDGQLGDATAVTRYVPTRVGSAKNWVIVSAGENHTCARNSVGGLFCWGNNQFGQLGEGTNGNRYVPTKVSKFSKCVNVSAGWDHTCATREDGSLWCFGRNNEGQLGDGSAMDSNVPKKLSSKGWKNLSAGGLFTCATKADGSLWCWGENSNGQLGNATTINYFTPIRIDSATNWLAVDGGANHTCGLKKDGTLYCWGNNELGQLGVATPYYDRGAPNQVGLETNWNLISLGENHICATKTDNTFFCWGDDQYGQLGIPGVWENTPKQVGILNTWSSIDLGRNHSCGLIAGKAYCWGRNNYGQLGIDNTVDQSTPSPVGILNTWTQISGGGNHTCARQSNGTLWCFGYGEDYGQLGDNNWTDSAIPVQESNAWSNWANLGTGYNHSCGIRSNGTLFCWGRNNRGQLGDNTNVDRGAPVQENSLATNWSKVEGGGEHTCAIKTDGTLWCWGRNNQGQLGLGGGGNRNVPTQVGTATDWQAITLGAYHTCGLRGVSLPYTLYCWGDNDYGQLGDNSYTDRNVPTQIGGAEWISVSANGYFTCAKKTTGALFCWGDNSFGQLGDASLFRDTPSEVIKP